MTTNQTVGNNLRRMREKLGATQDEVAAALSVNRSTYSNYEAGTREMPYNVLERAADFFGCESHLLFEDGVEAQNEMLATAFRLNGLSPEDYAEIIHFKDIVKTSLKLDRLLANE